MSQQDSWKEEIAIVGLVALGIVVILADKDSGTLAAIITAIAAIAGVKVGRKL